MLVRGVRWRFGASLLLVLTASVAVGAAAFGPLYLRAASDSLVRGFIVGGSVEQTGLTLSPQNDASVTFAQLTRDTRTLRANFGLDRRYGPPLETVLSGVGVPVPGGPPWQGQLLYRTGICSHLQFKQGRCELGTGDVLLSGRSARVMHAGLGSTIELSAPGATAPIRLHVTGIYAVPNLGLSYWWGDGEEDFPFGSTVGNTPQTDGLITSAATALAVPAADAPALTAQLPLRPSAAGFSDKAQIEQTIASLKRAASNKGVTASTHIQQLFAGAAHQSHLMNTIVAVASIQLVLVAIWALAALLLRNADLRSSELRIARLRGFPLISLLGVAVTEPAILCLLGTPIGVLSAWLLTLLAKGLFMSSSTSLSVGPLVFVALGAVIVAVAFVLMATALRALRNSELSERAAGGAESSGRLRLVADVSLLMLAAVAIVALSTSGALASHDNPIAAAAPGLLALGTTVIAVQLILFLGRRGVSLSTGSSWVPGILALRQVTRRPAILRQARVLIVTLCLACFAVCAWSIARSNRKTAVEFSLGASTVVTVTPHGTGLQQAVDKVDPRGRFAMAVAQINTPSAEVLGVDPSRLAAVASWPSGLTRIDVEQVAHDLAPATAAPIQLPSGSLRLDVEVAGAGKLQSHLSTFDLMAWVFNSQLTTTVINLGRLHAGSGTYAASIRAACPGGCRLLGLGVVPSSSAWVTSGPEIHLTLTGVAAQAGDGPYRSLAAGLDQGGWQSATQGASVASSSAGRVSFTLADSVLAEYASGAGSSPPMVAVADYPLNLPGVVGDTSLTGAGTQYGQTLVSSEGLDGGSISIKPVVTAPSLPRVGPNAEIVNLTFLTRAQLSTTTEGVADEVWLNSSAPADVISSLRRAGLDIDRVQRAAGVRSTVGQQGPGLAYDFMLLATLIALIAGAASALGLLGSAIRERATELTALEVSGVPRQLLVRSLSLESAVLALTTMFGAGAGIAGSVLAIPSLPQAATKIYTPRSYALPWPLLIAVCAGMVAVIALACAIATVGVLRRMSPTLLWSGSDANDN